MNQKHFPIEVRAFLIALSLALPAAGCSDPRPTSLVSFDQCTLGPIESVRRGEAQVEADCTIRDGLGLVGLPARAISPQELLAAGVPNEIAGLVPVQGNSRPQWCTFEKPERKSTAAAGSSETLVGRSNCSTTEMEVSQVVYSGPGRVRLTIVRSASGQPVLSKFAPL